jgi:flagellar biosynthesis protein FlhG
MRPRKATARATVLAITSGKGGVGKTNVTINVAIAMARLGLRVGVLDADFGLGNVDVLLGIAPGAHVGHVVAGEKPLREVVVRGPHGITIIPASSGLQSMTSLSGVQRDRLLAALDLACRELDFLLIDTAAGISDNVMEMLKLAERVVLVTSLEPSAIVDAYALTKVLTSTDAAKEIGVVVNGAKDADEASVAFRQIETATRRFLKRSVSYYGHVTDDPAVREAVLVQRAIIDLLPQSPASRCYRIVASRLAGLGPAQGGLRLAPRAGASGTVTSEKVPQCA